MTLSFRRLTPSLDTASNTTLLDTLRPGPLAGANIEGVAVAPIPSGWVIASCVSGQLYLFTVDAAGVNSCARRRRWGDHGCGYCDGAGGAAGRRTLAGVDRGVRSERGVDRSRWAVGRHALRHRRSPGDQRRHVRRRMGRRRVQRRGARRRRRPTTTARCASRASTRTARVTSRDLLMDEFEDMPRIARGATDTRVTYVAPDQLPAARTSSGGGSDRRASCWPMPCSRERSTATTRNPRPSRSATTPSCCWPTTAGLVVFPHARGPRRPDSHAPVRHPPRADATPSSNHDMVRRGPDAIVSWLSFERRAPRVGLARITP